MKTNAILIVLFLLFSSNVLICQDLEFQKINNFANKLYDEGEYYRAITEYKRILSYYPEYWDSIFIRIPDSYFNGHQYDEAISLYKQYFINTNEMKFKTYSLFQIGRSYLFKDDYYNSKQKFLKLANSESIEYSEKAKYYLSFIEAKKFNWQKSNEWLMLISGSQRKKFNIQQLSSQLEESENIPSKSPLLAGFLSAVIPGSGYCYVGNCKIGLASLLLNSLFIYGSYESFKQKSYVVGTTFIVVGLGWYTGNIFGAVTKAHRYNREMKQQFFDNLNFLF